MKRDDAIGILRGHAQYMRGYDGQRYISPKLEEIAAYLESLPDAPQREAVAKARLLAEGILKAQACGYISQDDAQDVREIVKLLTPDATGQNDG